MADSVTIAHINSMGQFWVDYKYKTPRMRERSTSPLWRSQIPREWEIIKSFLEQYSLSPTWIDCKKVWGDLDEETGTWTGAVGKVRIFYLKFYQIFIKIERDEADWAVPGIACTYGRSKVAL